VARRRQQLHLIGVHEYVIGRRPTVRDLSSALIMRDRTGPRVRCGMSSPVPDDLKASDVFAALFEETKRRERPAFDDN
jgi:hypothetical protein